MKLLPFTWTVLMSLRVESNGASPQRRKRALSVVLSAPSLFAHATSAASVGSPVTLPLSSSSASEHSAMAEASFFSSVPK